MTPKRCKCGKPAKFKVLWAGGRAIVYFCSKKCRDKWIVTVKHPEIVRVSLL